MEELFHGASTASPFFSINKLILKLSSPSGGQPYDFPICLAGRLHGQGAILHRLSTGRVNLLQICCAALSRISLPGSAAVILNRGKYSPESSNAAARGSMDKLWRRWGRSANQRKERHLHILFPKLYKLTGQVAAILLFAMTHIATCKPQTPDLKFWYTAR